MFRFFIKVSIIISLCCNLSYANLGDIDDDDLEHPIVTEGKAALQQENWEGAILLFEKALEDLSGSADVQNFWDMRTESLEILTKLWSTMNWL